MVLVVKNPPTNARDIRDAGWIPGLGKLGGYGQSTLVFLPRELHGQRTTAGYCSLGSKGSDVTEAT